MKALIVYGTRYGATAGTAEEIAKVLRDNQYAVDVIDAVTGRVDTVEGYDLIVVGSGIMIDKWTPAAYNFLERFKTELTDKKVAIFVSSAVQAIYQYEGATKQMERSQKKYIDKIADHCGITPIATAILGGVFPYDSLGWIMRKTVGQMWRKFEEAGYTKVNGAYDTRDWRVIRNWAKTLAHL